MIQGIEGKTITELTQNSKDSTIHKCLNLLGLNLSESEMNELKGGHIVSLETRGLSEIGSLFILAAALSASTLGKTRKPITFKDLPNIVSESASCSGIPVYSWNSESASGKWGLYLTLVDGKPALRVCGECYSSVKSSNLST